MQRKRTFKSTNTWLTKGRRIRLGVSGKFRPYVFVAMRDGQGDRYAYFTPEEARALAVSLIEVAAEADVIEAKAGAETGASDDEQDAAS